ncbi:hypothetical protein ACJW30_06G011600 [Castanea mollissima]
MPFELTKTEEKKKKKKKADLSSCLPKLFSMFTRYCLYTSLFTFSNLNTHTLFLCVQVQNFSFSLSLSIYYSKLAPFRNVNESMVPPFTSSQQYRPSVRPEKSMA